jgi:hypothetical protein
MGRNTPHFFGAGLVEMIGEEVRHAILDRYDRSRNGIIDRGELPKRAPVRLRPAPGAPTIDYGDLAPGPDGVPGLNSVFRVWYLDEHGCVVADASGFEDPRVVAFDFAMQVFGWGRGHHSIARGHGAPQGGEAATLREIYALAADVHMGLQAYDPAQIRRSKPACNEPAGSGGRAEVSLNGAQQFDFGASPDRGARLTDSGVSLDDPDGDGSISELTEGDLDAVEFYLLHTPQPAVHRSAASQGGADILHRVGCVRCHVENWQLGGTSRTAAVTGDRRFFRVDTRIRATPDSDDELVGALIRLDRVEADGKHSAAYSRLQVKGIYSDLRHWDVGPQFAERRYDGTSQRTHRTAPLWGVGSTAPYGHAGNFATLDQVIRAHGGAAVRERNAYLALPRKQRRRLLAYLESLTLYSTDEIPMDINGDGRLQSHFSMAGRDVGYERFDARFLFAKQPRFSHHFLAHDHNGRLRAYGLVVNIDEIYDREAPYLIDRNGDGFPDVLDPPSSTGRRRRDE